MKPEPEPELASFTRRESRRAQPWRRRHREVPYGIHCPVPRLRPPRPRQHHRPRHTRRDDRGDRLIQRWKQYGGLLGLFAAFHGAGYWGFTATGGALPWAKRSAKALQRGVQDGGGALVDFGRGIVVAGPIRKGEMMLEFAGLVVLLVVRGIGLYVYVDHYGGFEDGERSAP